MTCTISVQGDGRTVLVSSLSVSNPDFLAVITAQPKSNHEQAVLDVISVGSAAMRRVQTTVDVDLVDKRFGTLASTFERALSSFEKQVVEILAKRFSPTEAGSYTKHIGDLLGSARKDVQGWTKDMMKQSEALLDPDKKSSAVGRLEELIEEASDKFEQMFDPDDNDSYSSRLTEQLTSVFGGDGQPGVLNASLQSAIQPILKELRELKEKVEGRKAAEQVIASSSLKGRPFEEQVYTRLAQLAQPYGDDVLAVGSGNGGSRAGDFLVGLNGSGKVLVVEARDRRQMSLPAIKADLDRERTERAADLAIYVSSGPEMLPQHVGDFQVYDDKIVTTIDNLHIAYRIARLTAISQAPEGAVDVNGLRTVLSKLRDAASSLRNAKSKASQISKLAAGVNSDAEATETTLIALIDEAEALLVEPVHA